MEGGGAQSRSSSSRRMMAVVMLASVLILLVKGQSNGTASDNEEGMSPGNLVTWLAVLSTLLGLLLIGALVWMVILCIKSKITARRLRILENDVNYYGTEVSRVVGRDLTRHTVKRGESVFNEFTTRDTPAVDVAGVTVDKLTRGTPVKTADSDFPARLGAPRAGRMEVVKEVVQEFEAPPPPPPRPNDGELVGVFRIKTIGPEGGTVCLRGVALEIPQDALTSATKITIGVLWHDWYRPELPAKQALLSPIISCEADGRRITKPVTLHLAHCARGSIHNWKPHYIKSETKRGEQPNWKELSFEDCSVREAGEHSVKMQLKHFTLYAIAGETPRKVVKLVPFAPELHHDEELFPVRVYCINHYKEMEEIRVEEKNMRGLQVDSLKPLFVNNDGGNVCVEMDKVPANWKLHDTTELLQELSFMHVWHATQPSCTFLMESKPQAVRQVACKFLGYQTGHATEDKVTMVVAQKEKLKPPENKVFPSGLLNMIAINLDPDIFTANNWQVLADRMGKDYHEITYLNDLKDHSQSPTESLLNEWADTGNSLKDFRVIMNDLERFDVLDDIDRFLQQELHSHSDSTSKNSPRLSTNERKPKSTTSNINSSPLISVKRRSNQGNNSPRMSSKSNVHSTSTDGSPRTSRPSSKPKPRPKPGPVSLQVSG